jgi:hypothetical protein
MTFFKSWSLLLGVLACGFWAWIGLAQHQPLAFVFGGVPLAAVLVGGCWCWRMDGRGQRPGNGRDCDAPTASTPDGAPRGSGGPGRISCRPGSRRR